MPSYAYTARNPRGETAKGTLPADSPAEARRQLKEKGLFVISLDASARSAAGAVRGPGRGKVSRKDLMTLTSQLSIMTKTGLDIAGALESLARQCGNPRLKSTLEMVHQEVLGGKSVSAAMKGYPEVFDQTYVASVAAGETSGQLPEVLSRLAALQRTELRLVATRRALLAYPIVLASVSGLVVLALMLFVLPQFSQVFDQFEMPLPALTQALLAFSNELRARFWLWGMLLGATVIGAVMYRRSPAGRRHFDAFMLHAVLLRDVTRSISIGRAFRLLGLMIESGVPLLEGLRLTRSSLRNVLLGEMFDRLETDVLNGLGLAHSLAGFSFVPNGASEMISTAERTGTLGMVTQVMGEFYEEQGETRLRELATLIEPLLIVVMGAIVAVVVLAVMLPMFDFATVSQSGH